MTEEFEVEARDAEAALDIAAQKYRKGEFVLAPGEVQFKRMAIVSPNSECIRWKEF